MSRCRLRLSALALILAASPGWAMGSRETPECRPSFSVDDPLPSGLALLAVGDVGDGGQRQQAVARAMALHARGGPADLVLLLGDNFYPRGVSSARDHRWDLQFERMYDPAFLDMPFYAVLGNHDHRGDPLAQVEYRGPTGRWRMPARYYDVRWVLDDGATIQLFVLDTNTILREPAQGRWLHEALAASTADWKIVAGHHVLYSNGRYGNDRRLIAALTPQFETHGVDVYLSGHEHDLQILGPTAGVWYLVSGAGSRLRRTGCGDNTVYAASRAGFMSLRFSAARLAVLVVLESGLVDHALVIEKARTSRPRQSSRTAWGGDTCALIAPE